MLSYTSNECRAFKADVRVCQKKFVSVFFYGGSQPDIARSCGLHHLQAFLVIKLYSMIKIHKMLSYIGLENSEK